MDPVPKQRKRRWFRFSIRSMLAFVTLVCIYSACWVPTKSRGTEDVAEFLMARNNGKTDSLESLEPIAPMLFRRGLLEIHARPNKVPQLVTDNTYYFWCFGFVTQLPFTTTHTRDLPMSPESIEFQGLPIQQTIQTH